MSNTQLVWLRRDLRLADNPALYHAAKAGPVVCVYVLDDEAPKHHAYGGASRWWLHHSLASLARSLEATGSKLILRRGDAVEELTKLAAETGAATIHANCHYEPWWLQRRAQAGQEPRLATPPRQLPDGAGQHHHRHGRTVQDLHPVQPRGARRVPTARRIACARNPDRARRMAGERRTRRMEPAPHETRLVGWYRAHFWQVGEAAAHARLAAWEADVDGYDDKRNLPSVDKVSRLSPHLHFGEISPIQIWHAFKHKRSKGWRTFESELIWRDYSQNAILQFPTMPARTTARISTASRGAIPPRTKPPRAISKPGSRAAPATRSSMPGCASCGRPAGCTTACG